MFIRKISVTVKFYKKDIWSTQADANRFLFYTSYQIMVPSIQHWLYSDERKDSPPTYYANIILNMKLIKLTELSGDWDSQAQVPKFLAEKIL